MKKYRILNLYACLGGNRYKWDEVSDNGWRYGVGLLCRLFQPTTAVTGKLHYTACCVSGAGLTDKFD